MPVKIVIDAGHGGYDAGASFGDRKEKDEVLRLALAVGDILKKQGYDVVYTRTEDVYDSPVQKARIGNESGADFFVSIHRNSSPTPNQYNGVQTLVYDNSGIKQTMAENINKQLEELGFRNINVPARPDLAVLRRTKMPAVLVEAGFINSDIDNELFDSKFNEIAQGIADGIDETLRSAGYTTASAIEGENQAEPVASYYQYAKSTPVFANAQDDGTIHRDTEEYDYNDVRYNNEDQTTTDGNGVAAGDESVQSGDNSANDGQPVPETYQILIGIYRSFGSASYQLNRLINEGYFAEIFEDENLYQVRVGEYANIEEALIAQRELRDKGYETLIVRAY